MSVQSFEFEVELMGASFIGTYRVDDGVIESITFDDGRDNITFETAAGSYGEKISARAGTVVQIEVAQYVLRCILASPVHRDEMDRTRRLETWLEYAPVRL